MSLFDLLHGMALTAPLGAIGVGAKVGARGALTGAMIGLLIGSVTFVGVICATHFFGRRMSRMQEGSFQELAAWTLVIGEVVCIFAAAFAAMHITTLVTGHAAD